MNPAVYYLSSLETFIPYVPTEVQIPNGQIWDQFNLNTSVYSDGTPIPRSTGPSWPSLTTGACRFYENDSSNAVSYGRLYNWYAVNGVDGSGITKDIAPEGWRVATLDDWTNLSNYYGGNALSGGKLKQDGFDYWLNPNTGALSTNIFNARGGGFAAATNSTFAGLKASGYWWPFGAPSTRFLSMAYNDDNLDFNMSGLPTRGYSVRLIKKDITIPGFTTTLSSYDANSIETGGDIPTSYTETISERGIVWGTSPNPNIIGQLPNKIPSGDGTGSYSVTISGLTPVTTYYIRAYAIISSGSTQGTAYAAERIVVTESGLVTVTTSETITSIGANSATGGGDITYIDPEYPVIVSGLVWDTSTNPTVSLSTKTTDGPTGTTTGSFTSTMNGLLPLTTYYVRAYATNSISGTSYGNNVQFNTIAGDALKYAYSLRRVVPGYTGPAIQVRIGTSTTLLQDFYFDAITGELSQADILSFVGPTSIGYISKWYDQSGSANTLGVRDIIPGREPRIITNGVFSITNGRLSVSSSGGIVYLRSAFITPFSENNLSTFIVYSSQNLINTQNVLGIGGTQFPRPLNDGFDYFRYNGSNRIQLGPVSTSNKIYSNLTTSTGVRAWKNNVSLGPEVSVVSSASVTTINFGYQNVAGTFQGFAGTVQEILIYTGDTINRTAITANAIAYYSII